MAKESKVSEMAGSSVSPRDSLNSHSCDADSSFVWDESSQLYFHASSGFFHDPTAGWYYSSKDGLYYKFEDGNYVLLNSSSKSDNAEVSGIELDARENSNGDDLCAKTGNENEDSSLLDEVQAGTIEDSSPEDPRPPSEWLEETLIDLYLSGYSNQAENGGTSPFKMDKPDKFDLQADGDDELEEGEWIPEDDFDVNQASENTSGEDFSREEENWRAQYGQVVPQAPEETIPEVPAIDLWDWSMVRVSRKDGKGDTAKLVGRLMKRSVKLHPSMPSGGGLLRTAPIREVHIDLVRVASGQIYKLRNPSAKFVASVATYDASNPTRDWEFPELSLNAEQTHGPATSRQKKDPKENLDCNNLPQLQDLLVACGKNRSHAYRDRAAERRALHGCFGVAPGEKSSALDECDDSQLVSPDEAANEALNMSFGSGSYARKLLVGMGWKEGETLGKSGKGLVAPIEAEGNIGSAGLGFPRGRSKYR